MSRDVLVLNGPNLNLLGRREPTIYGASTLSDIDSLCIEEARRLDLEAVCHQSNSEGELVTKVQDVADTFVGLIINPGAYAHTSIALLDAVRSLKEPVIEVHLSNIHQRETFRHHSYISLAAKAVICGFGPAGYALALNGLAAILNEDR